MAILNYFNLLVIKISDKINPKRSLEKNLPPEFPDISALAVVHDSLKCLLQLDVRNPCSKAAIHGKFLFHHQATDLILNG